MITDETHPEMVRAAADLRARLAALAKRRPRVDRETLRQALEARDMHRATWRARGVDFPHLVVISVPRLGTRSLELWREDLDQQNLRVKIVNLVKLYPEIMPKEVAAALQAAYPRLKPGDLVRPVFGAVYQPEKIDTAEARKLEQYLKGLN